MSARDRNASPTLEEGPTFEAGDQSYGMVAGIKPPYPNLWTDHAPTTWVGWVPGNKDLGSGSQTWTLFPRPLILEACHVNPLTHPPTPISLFPHQGAGDLTLFVL